MDRLVPSLDRPRARVAPRAWLALAAALLVAALALALALAATVERTAGRCLTAAPTAPACAAPTLAPTPTPPAAPSADEPPVDEPPPVIPAGTCRAMIAPLRQPTTAADAAALRAMVGAWLADARTPGPGIEHRRGVVHIDSEEDRGDEPPYPRSAEPEATRVCGSATGWLRTYLREALAWQADALVCDGNVCCYDGMEYAPSGYVVFHHGPGDDAPWTLDAWVEVYDAGLGPEYVDANLRFVSRAIRRLAHGRCAGEPAGRID
ncbi:MAG: hypothetical protein IPH44_08535 [Myxococcales bacterium]|nr:hypothetical protein [Myxococcales bacterium]MBK7198598.1 hypothetical protein [Myxococcales bacterium]MBP6843271.1 hypothetical protein [Kofleriaceae bacterium]